MNKSKKVLEVLAKSVELKKIVVEKKIEKNLYNYSYRTRLEKLRNEENLWNWDKFNDTFNFFQRILFEKLWLFFENLKKINFTLNRRTYAYAEASYFLLLKFILKRQRTYQSVLLFTFKIRMFNILATKLFSNWGVVV